MSRVLDLAAVAGLSTGDTIKLPTGRESVVHPLTMLHYATWQQCETASVGTAPVPDAAAIVAALRCALPDLSEDEVGDFNPLQIILVLRVAGGAGEAAALLVKAYLERYRAPPPEGEATAPPTPGETAPELDSPAATPSP